MIYADRWYAMQTQPHHTFADRLAWVLAQRDLTTTDLHYETRIDRPNLARILAGEQEPRLGTLTKIAKATGASADYLIGLSSEPWLQADNLFQRKAASQ